VIDSPASSLPDLRRAPLADLRTLDLRSAERDFWTDEASVWDRFSASWAGLDDTAWALPGAAPSDAGGPDWSLAEHVGHVADWQELAIDYIGAVLAGRPWPSDDDYDSGDFDTYNERRREPWASMPPATIRDRLAGARARLLELARRLPLGTIRGDEAWGWVYMVLHGHYLDHLAVIEPWAASLRRRQVDGDPFVADPRPVDFAVFWAADASWFAGFGALVRRVPPNDWTREPLTPGWTLREHVAHVADWAEEGVQAIEAFRRDGTWAADPEEGIDAWNARVVARSSSASVPEVLARLDSEYARMRAAVATLTLDELRTPDGWSWAYDCLYGHVRKHMALVGPWCAAIGWPEPAQT
jgi:DinB family protein